VRSGLFVDGVEHRPDAIDAPVIPSCVVFLELKKRVFPAEPNRLNPNNSPQKRKMILTKCAACAAPLAHTAPRCIRCLAGKVTVSPGYFVSDCHPAYRLFLKGPRKHPQPRAHLVHGIDARRQHELRLRPRAFVPARPRVLRHGVEQIHVLRRQQ
jgi:hypothetical protein